MPRGNGNGPENLGPMTGRGFGYCAGYNRPGYMVDFAYRHIGRAGRGFRRGAGYGRGIGFGRGYHRGYARPAIDHDYPVGTDKEELNYLKADARALKEELAAIQKRIGEIEQESNE